MLSSIMVLINPTHQPLWFVLGVWVRRAQKKIRGNALFLEHDHPLLSFFVKFPDVCKALFIFNLRLS